MKSNEKISCADPKLQLKKRIQELEDKLIADAKALKAAIVKKDDTKENSRSDYQKSPGVVIRKAVSNMAFQIVIKYLAAFLSNKINSLKKNH
jgi:hypothetical protein